MTGDDEDFGFAEICAVLSERFRTRFKLQNSGGDCVTLVAHLEGGIELLITDCEETLSPAAWHLDGRAAGFYVGVHRAELDTDSVYVDLPDQFAYTCSETAPPTAEAIGDLVQEALENATIQFLHDQIAKGGRRHAEEQYQDLGVQYHVLPALDSLHALNTLREAAGL
jgi:hypothetical protein